MLFPHALHFPIFFLFISFNTSCQRFPPGVSPPHDWNEEATISNSERGLSTPLKTKRIQFLNSQYTRDALLGFDSDCIRHTAQGFPPRLQTIVVLAIFSTTEHHPVVLQLQTFFQIPRHLDDILTTQQLDALHTSIDAIMTGPGRPRKVKATAEAAVLTPDPEVEIRELTLEDQHQKRTEIMNQMKDDLWYERQSDSEMAMQILKANGFDCPPHSLQIVQQFTKAVEIDHEIDVAVDERGAYQKSLRGRGWWIYEEFGIDYLTQPTCEWARFQKWCAHEFMLLGRSCYKQEMSGQEYIEKAKNLYRTMNDFQATYWDKLRQDRVELEYQKWLFAVRKSVQEQELPVDKIWDIEAGEVVLSALEATSAKSIQRFMEDECHLSGEHASRTQQWIARKVGSSKLIFGLSPEHRGLVPSLQTPSLSEGSNIENGAHGAINDDGAEVSEEELSLANIPPARGIIQGGLWLSKLGAKKRFNAKQLPPLPKKEPWIWTWDQMSDAQKARMREIHYGKNDEYHRPSRNSGPAPNNTHTPGNAPKNPIDLDQEDQNNDLAGQQDRDGAAATTKTRSETSEELELSNQTETTSIQQGQHEAAAAQSTKGSQPMEKTDSTGSNHPLMIGPNGNGDDDGSKPPSQGGGNPSKGHYKQKSVVIDNDGDDSAALDDVEDNWLDPEVEARVMGAPCAAASQKTHDKRGSGRPESDQNPENECCSFQNSEAAIAQPHTAAAQPTTEPTAQSPRVREAVLFRTPIVPAPEESPRLSGLPLRGTFSDAPNSDILIEQRTNDPLSAGPYNADAGLNVSSTMDSRLGTVVRTRKPPSAERPRIGPRPDNMNQRLNEAIRRASQTPPSSGNGFVPINRPVPHAQPSSNTHRPNVPAAQVQPSETPVSQSTGPVSVPARPRANEQATGILVRNTDGTLTPAASPSKRRRSHANQMDEGFRQRRFSNENHPNQQMSSSENFGVPTRQARSASTSSTQRSNVPMMGVPMTPQKSHPGFKNMPRHPQQEGLMNRIIAPPKQHDGFSQRLLTQRLGNQARGPSYQNPNMMPQVSSMNYNGPSGNAGAGATQIQAPQFGSNGYLSMTTNQQDLHSAHTSTMNGYGVEKCSLSNEYPGHQGCQSFQQPNTLYASGWPNMPNNMDPFASPLMQNSTNGYGIAQASPNMSNSAHGVFGQPSHGQHNFMPSGYGMAQSSPDMHNSMHGNRMAQPPSGLRRHRPSMENSQQGRSTGMRYGQDVPMNQRGSQSEIHHKGHNQLRYVGPMRTSNNPHDNMRLNGSVEASQIAWPVGGQTPNGRLPPPGSRTQSGGASLNNQQNARTLVGQSPPTDTSQKPQGPQSITSTNGEPNEMKRRPGRPRRSSPQHPQPQNLALAPAPSTQTASPRTWTADQSVYNNRPVNTAYGKLYFGQSPLVLRHVPPPPSGPPSGTGSLQNIELIEQNYTFPTVQVQTSSILEHQMGVAHDLGLSLQPPPAAPTKQQPDMNNLAAVLALQQHSPQPEPFLQQEPAARNPFIDPSSLALSLAPATQDDVLPQYVPTAPSQQVKQPAEDNEHVSYGDGMGSDNWDFLITPPPRGEDGGNMYFDLADDPFGGANFDEIKELV
ncbi:hypothetical protein NA56DRAFT_98905 [Hyaloscypha hepaticicola]|uniref:LisH domain-containing protein n=1 Tax=Hyaloscypha hepaticicola TaxID=2082293 RepID=A0A2J6Q7T9_9HELO|nr:hypothetical protein NA56DRAFT_98905 [Hyaloscypha hepaticicola]